MMNDQEPIANAEAAIRQLLDRFARAFREKDVSGVMAAFARDIVSFNILPPLQTVGAQTFVTHWHEFFESHQGPIHAEFPDVRVAAGDDVAFSYCVHRIKGTLKNGQQTEWWLRRKLIQKPHIPFLKEHNVRVGFFEREQFQVVLAHLPEAVRPATTFAYITGWRIDSEVLSLEWRQVDFGAGEVRLDPGKTKNGEGRTFPMTRELREMLEQQRAITENLQRQLKIVCPRVFHRSGRPIKSFRVAFRTACAATGCPGRVLHDFRRTAVRNLVRAGIPERVAMQMTGHKTRSVLERYSIVSAGDLREAARRLDVATGTISGTIEQNQRSASKA